MMTKDAAAGGDDFVEAEASGQKAATAASLAPFRTAPAVPPLWAASKPSFKAAKRS